MENNIDFLQSEEWRKFQAATGKRTFHISADGFWANIIEHTLPIVGKYFYIPRGPIFMNHEARIMNQGIKEIINLAKKEKSNWIRIDGDYKNSDYKIVKAPHDMQPQEVFVIDIEKSEEVLLNAMKQKTRYNLKLAEKRGVKIFTSREKKYIDHFCDLVEITAKRDKITPHPRNYYQKMLATIPESILRLYVAEYDNKIIAANLVVLYGDTATYLHGASDNEYRNVMAPYLLQWQQIQDAKKVGCVKYDFGGVKTNGGSSWAGITKFKTGFAPDIKPIEFPGSYDIVVNPMKYYLYRFLQTVKGFVK